MTKLALLLHIIFSIGAVSAHQKDCFLHALSNKKNTTTHQFREETPEDKKRFDEILTILEDLFTSRAQELGGELRMVRDEWPFNSLNVRMRRGYHGNDGPIWRVIPTGGIFRHKLMNEDAFILITCHEIGHHIGGLPKKWGIANEFYWSTTEGQADYFAALKCFRQYAESVGGNDRFLNIDDDPLLDQKMKKSCAQSHPTLEAQAICLRTIRAGIVMARFSAHYRGDDLKKLDPHVPDPEQVEHTDDGHPKPQCRLDTYISGALCDKNPWDFLSDQDPHRAACTQGEVGARPLCWFNPETPYLPSQRQR